MSPGTVLPMAGLLQGWGGLRAGEDSGLDVLPFSVMPTGMCRWVFLLKVFSALLSQGS